MHQCHECSPAEFQVLFERIMKRLDPRFMPSGRTAKWEIGSATSSPQLMAPRCSRWVPLDELKQKALLAKIEEDSRAPPHIGAAC